MHKKLIPLLFGLLLATGALVRAEPVPDQGLTEAIAAVFPDVDDIAVKPSPIPGLHEIMLGTELVYLTDDARYLLQGDLIDLERRANLSEQARAKARQTVLANIPTDETIDFVPDEVRHTIYVFTDITCGYCRQFHLDVDELNARGVAVRYLAYPRAGPDSAPFTDMESVWCAADQNTAMTLAKRGEDVPLARCENPVRGHYALGGTLGVRGTPAIYLEDGRALPGYLPPDTLLQALVDQ